MLMSMPMRLRSIVLLAVHAATVVVCLSPGRLPGQDRAGKNTKSPQTILIIRHAEKTGADNDLHLSGPGKQRAEAIAKLFEASKDRPEPFPKPDYIFAAHLSKNSDRPIETVTPMARQLNLEINSRYD